MVYIVQVDLFFVQDHLLLLHSCQCVGFLLVERFDDLLIFRELFIRGIILIIVVRVISLEVVVGIIITYFSTLILLMLGMENMGSGSGRLGLAF